jgi:hypothetical protein
MVELLVALQKQWPQKRWIISTAPTERERVKLDQLLKALPWKPWKAFSGSLDLMPALIQHSALHLSGDTGMRHVALMTGTPSVVWFRPFSGMEAWIPATGLFARHQDRGPCESGLRVARQTPVRAGFAGFQTARSETVKQAGPKISLRYARYSPRAPRAARIFVFASSRNTRQGWVFVRNRNRR